MIVDTIPISTLMIKKWNAECPFEIKGKSVNWGHNLIRIPVEEKPLQRKRQGQNLKINSNKQGYDHLSQESE